MTDLRSFVALHPPGACRTPGGGTGTYSERWGLALPQCEAACKPDPHCRAFEFAQYLARTGTSKCELHTDRIAFAAPVSGAACYVKSGQQASYGKMATPPPVMAAAAVPAQARECARLANAWFDLASTARLRLHNNALLPGVLIHNLEPEATGRGDLLRFGDPRTRPFKCCLARNRLPASLVSRSISNRSTPRRDYSRCEGLARAGPWRLCLNLPRRLAGHGAAPGRHATAVRLPPRHRLAGAPPPLAPIRGWSSSAGGAKEVCETAVARGHAFAADQLPRMLESWKEPQNGWNYNEVIVDGIAFSAAAPASILAFFVTPWNSHGPAGQFSRAAGRYGAAGPPVLCFDPRRYASPFSEAVQRGTGWSC
ncbi:hypothetical protein EMIHUDRAFT_444131 [Emiliania huxleyi CCMP1516]|uniref:Apple domain-containing protein n=2 Tax=Emiliania huxleyi TaxID=2903 RepID=A0A0D3JIT6_EMIH1|nr:hypothetical protein EMIHUDRAFT_444131 [Emiliania huxleyi CCMP1516]EOD23421.1 hypothetical protein EMIHUDRAFT_444131 [Emiliania huxleyi CCMP1516]|eukprot:XP_005775850.1 hypothetical protein EMIHUDRAFT_444131 [Emiliania huxleyi CCMP1516]